MEESEVLWFRFLQDEDSAPDNVSSLEESEDGSPLWFVGVFLYAFGAFSLALGVVLQKLSINRELKRASIMGTDMKPKYKQKLWVFGIIMYGSSGGLLSAALAFAAQSLLTPLMSVVIISNALLARFLLNEPLTKRDFFCVIIIVMSVILTTVSAPTSEDKKTTDELLDLYEEPLFIVFIVSLLSFMLFLWVINKALKKKKQEKGLALSKREEFMFSFSFGASAGCWGGLCVTMIKSAITIIQDKASGDNFFLIFQEFIVYILLLILITCWYQQLNWINKGLELYPAVFIVSIEAVINEIVAVSGGLLYFKEYQKFDAVFGSLFGLGMLLGVAGIFAFAMRDNNVTAKDDFFTNSALFSCCKCCFLKEIEKDDYNRPKTRSVASMELNGSTVFLDEKGNEINPKEKEIVYEHIDGPITLLAGAAKNLADAIAYQEEVNEETGKKEKRARFSVKRAVSKTSNALRQSLRRGGLTSPFPRPNSAGSKSIDSKPTMKEEPVEDSAAFQEEHNSPAPSL